MVGEFHWKGNHFSALIRDLHDIFSVSFLNFFSFSFDKPNGWWTSNDGYVVFVILMSWHNLWIWTTKFKLGMLASHYWDTVSGECSFWAVADCLPGHAAKMMDLHVLGGLGVDWDCWMGASLKRKERLEYRHPIFTGFSFFVCDISAIFMDNYIHLRELLGQRHPNSSPSGALESPRPEESPEMLRGARPWALFWWVSKFVRGVVEGETNLIIT